MPRIPTSPEFLKIKEKIDKLDNVIKTTRTRLDKIEYSLKKKQVKRNKWIEEKVKLYKSEAIKERIKFVNNFSLKHSKILIFNQREGGNGTVDDYDHFSRLPLDMFEAICKYMGPVELIVLSTVSRHTEKRLCYPLFLPLFTDLCRSMIGSLKDDFTKNEFSHYLENKMRSIVEKTSKMEEEDDMKKTTSKIRLVRLLFRMLYILYINHRVYFTVNCPNGRQFVDNPQLAFIFTTSTNSISSFLPLKNGMFLETGKKHSFSTDSWLNTMQKQLEHVGALITFEHARGLMTYDDCVNLKLKNIADAKERVRRKHVIQLKYDKIHVSKIVYFASDMQLRLVPFTSIRQLSTSYKHYKELYRLPFIDYYEIRMFDRLSRIRSVSFNDDLSMLHVFCCSLLEM